MNYIEAIEELSKSENLHSGDKKSFTKEILLYATETLNCERANIWFFNADKSELHSYCAYSRNEKAYSKIGVLKGVEAPNYFSYLKRNEIIVSQDATKEEANQELLESYLIPNNIIGMIDIPIRSEGKMVGVICFEHVGKEYQWSDEEKSFCQSAAQLLSLAYETSEKQKFRDQLEDIIQQKEVLIQEINHRVKNNLAVIMSLLNLQKLNVKDDYHGNLFEVIKDKVYSMSLIQEQLHSSDNLDKINLENFIRNLVQHLNFSHGNNKNIQINMELEEIQVDVSKAIPCGLIANETLTNSFKYAFGKQENPKIKIKSSFENKHCYLEFEDNGIGFDPNLSVNGMGMELMHDLTAQIDGKITIDSQDGVRVVLSFPI